MITNKKTIFYLCKECKRPFSKQGNVTPQCPNCGSLKVEIQNKGKEVITK